MLTKSAIQRAVLGLAAAAALSAVPAQNAYAARSFPPDVGRAVNFSEENCFTIFDSSVVNTNCSGSRSYEVPLIFDTVGSKTVTVSVLAQSVGGVSCRFVVSTRDATSVVSSPAVASTLVGSFQHLSVGPVTIPASGRAYLNCQIAQNSRVNTVAFTP